MGILETLKTKELVDFIKEKKKNNRNITNNRIFDMLKDESTNPEIILNNGNLLYRSRVITDDNINKEPNFYGYGKEGSFIPPKNVTRDMRANRKGIPYLYCSSQEYITISEVRPRFGADLSIATIRVNEAVRLLDFTVQDEFKCGDDLVKKKLFDDLSQLFAKPITKEDETTDYIPTQYIAEYVKNLGYDGIAYSSSIVPDLRSKDDYNVVIFNYYKCEAIQSNVVNVNLIIYEATQTDKCDKKLNVENWVVKKLKEI